MKIVLPVHHFLPRYSAGAELYTYRLAQWLQAHGHDVAVVCVDAIDQGAAGELQAVSDRYQGIRVEHLSFNLGMAADPMRWSYDNPLLGEWFARYFERERPDLAHFQAGYLIGAAPLRAAAQAGIPTILTLHDYWFVCPRITLQRGDDTLCAQIPNDPAECAWCQCLESRRYRYPDRLTGGLAGQVIRTIALRSEGRKISERRSNLHDALAIPNALISPSHFLANYVREHVPASRLHQIRGGLDLAPFRAVSRAMHSDGLHIGFIGQVVPHKGVHLLVEAFQKLVSPDRPLTLHIYGSLQARPDYVAQLQKLAQGKANILFHGRFENGGAPAILSNLDLLVVPSIWYENSPIAILEAQAAGTPVVTSALGGMAELVSDGVDGLHFQPNSASDLAAKLQRLIDQPELLTKLQAGVRMPASIDDEMEQLLAIYENVVAHPLVTEVV